MQNNKLKQTIKAAIFSIIVAFLIVIVVVILSIKIGKEKFQMATDLIDIVTVTEVDENNRISPVLQTVQNNDIESQKTEDNESDGKKENSKVLLNCPDYGSKYARIKIPSAQIDLPIYYGKSLELLKNGIGHDNDSYFPGEGGSIILMGHNFKKILRNIPKAQIGDGIDINTEYGDFSYKIYDIKIVDENETEQLPIQKKEEILMIYTCWPINNIGYTTQRYVVYAK